MWALAGLVIAKGAAMIWEDLYASKEAGEAAMRRANAAMTRANGAAKTADECAAKIEAIEQKPIDAPVFPGDDQTLPGGEIPVDYDPGDFTLYLENAMA